MAATDGHAPPVTFRERMHVAYLAAELFALESWCDAGAVVETRSRDARVHGASAALGQALMARDMWHMEAERCGGIAGALAKMGP